MSDEQATPTIESTESTETAATKRPLSLLASEMFGSSFTGDVSEEAPEAAEVGNDEPETAEAPEVVETEAAEASEAPLSSVTELVQHYEFDPEWFDALEVVDLKVDGKPAKATLKDLKDSYQIKQAAEHRLEEAKSKAKSIVQEAAAKSEALQAQFAVAAKLIENAESALNQEAKNIDWSKLREDDPAEYSARKADLTERRERVEQMKREAVESYQQTLAKGREEAEEALKQHLQKEHGALLEKLPEWRDAEKAKAGKARVAEYLIGQGFSQQDVTGASDHRLILMARKAMLFDELQANTDAAKKKVAKVPKVLKPGAPKPQEQVNREREKEARQRLRRSGKLDDAFALLQARRGGRQS